MNQRALTRIRSTGYLCAGLMAAPVLGQVPFTDATGEAGLTMTHSPHVYTQWGIVVMAAGGVVGDFDRDGWQDLFVISGGTVPDKLYVNNGDGTFTDEAAQWGLTDLHRGMAASVGDFNGDGWLDIYVTSLGEISAGPTTGAHRLYQNNGGTGFTEVAAAAGVNTTSPTIRDGFGSAFGDYDLDGDLDLFVAGWEQNSDGNRLFRNNGDGTFTDVTVAAGVYDPSVHGFSPRFVDMDGDRYPELLLTGDFGTSRYFVNNTDGTFTDQTGPSGTGLDGNGMGQAVGDINNDGLFDWYVTSILTVSPSKGVPGTGNMLYLNQGNHVYSEISVAAGVNDGGWGWGTVAVDINHDGRVDLLETNGWPAWPDDEFLNEQAKVFDNLGANTFSEIAALCSFNHTGQGRGLLNFDADNDGDQDFVVFSVFEPLEFYRNEMAGPNHWLRVFLDTSEKPSLAPDGFGSVVRATAGGQSYYRSIDGGCNFLSQSELSAHFGLGLAAVDELRVQWADGSDTVIPAVAADQTITVTALATDLNGDCAVNVLDLIDLLLDFGGVGGTSDVNQDGAVNVLDLIALLLDFGRGCVS